MILVQNATNRVILAGKQVELFNDHAFCDGEYTYGKLNPNDYTVYNETLPKPYKAGQAVFINGTFDYTAKALQEKLEKLKSIKILSVNSKTAKQITEGFISNALGQDYYYKATIEDQLNLIGLSRASGNREMKCSLDGENWDYVVHTPPQIQQVLDDGATIKHAILKAAHVKKKLIKAATTLSDLEAIEV